MPRILAPLLIAVALAAPAVPAGATSLSGAYLAATQADLRDDYAEAARYYDQVLQLDPENVGILTNALVARVALGDFAAAGPLAERLEAADPNNQVATLVRLGTTLAAGEFTATQAILDKTSETLNPLLGALLGGWVDVGLENFDAAREAFDGMGGNDAFVAYGQYHKALALAFAGDFVGAEAIMAGGEDGPLHLNRSSIVAHAEILAQIGREADAVQVIDDALAGGVPDAPLLELRARLASGQEVPFDVVTRARDGAAEAFLTLADALNTSDSQRVALLHARIAGQIRPDLTEAHLLSAELLEDEGQHALATEALASVPETSPWYVTAQIRRAATQNAAGDPEAGIVTLTALAAGHPDQIEVQSALGDALRMAERYPEAVAAYDAAVALIGAPMPLHWPLYYTRGIANERAGNWPAAEADFREALKLEPDQPLVLNYLGYSLVEKHEKLDEALGMIEKASKAEPEDGYITDSLGWVLYRMGRYDEAVKPMLRAVELTPDDPVINDHLGDVLWMVGRKREAEFQWRRALSFGPADDLDMDRIRKKLEVGLDRVLTEEPKRDG
ncbi:MAG TPA: tetratricopeptide repeat protein [Amaricoccus sp.]|nr:tetratricopeptide repeat protein [Amaricoccus sp.]